MEERELSATTAEQKIRQTISSLSLSPSVDYINASKTVAIGTLKNSLNVTVAEGAGKGANSCVGALAESLEHYALEHMSHQGIFQLALSEIRNQPLVRMDGILSNLPDSDIRVDCVEMANIQTDQRIMMPAVLQMPTDLLTKKIKNIPEAAFLARYASNSGIAFGCSENEAILHGLNEVIERHTLSKILMSLCGQHESIQLCSPSAETLAQLLSDNMETYSTADNFKIILTPTTQGVYFSMAIPKRADGRYPICPVGSGCSVDPRIAISRAVTELVQTTALYDADAKTNDLHAYALMERSPSLRPLIHLEKLRNVGQICQRLDPPLKLSVAEQTELVIEHLDGLGFRVLHRTLASFANGCVVSQVYVPGLERFNLVRAGIPVVPQQLLRTNACSI
jgi:ribosomal protein S12 methylthiotransferase accessory factor